MEKMEKQIIKVNRKYSLSEEKEYESDLWAINAKLNAKYEEKIVYIKKTATKIRVEIISTNYLIQNRNIKFTLYPSKTGTKIYYNGVLDYTCSSDGTCSLSKNDIKKIKDEIHNTVQ
jgi:hypothetical protein